MDTLPVVINHDEVKDDSFNLRHRDTVCMNTVEFFFLQCSEKTSHPGVIITFSRTVHALDRTEACKRSPKSGAGELADPARLSRYGLYAESRPHIVIHSDLPRFRR